MGEDTPFDAEAIERGHLLFRADCQFLKGCVSMDGLPDHQIGEVAFAGRSNVGKSSLLNAMTGRNGIARTSNTPGRTQEVNFFHLGPSGDDELSLVDLPGYGYAKVSKSKVKAWTGLIRDYLRGRAQLRRVLVLIDSRHGFKDSDRDIFRMLDEAAMSYQIVLTKIDKLTRDEQAKVIAKVTGEAQRFVACHPRIHATSAQKGWGLDDLRAEIAMLV